MFNKIQRLLFTLFFIIGGGLMVYGTVGAVTYIMVPQGGTGAGTYASQAVLIGSSTNPIATTTWTVPQADGTANQILKTNGSGSLTWQADALGGAGDIAQLGQIGDVSTTTLATGYTLAYDSNNEWTATSTLFVDESGKVGIGTTTPAYDLDVYGNIRADGDVRTTGTFYGDTWSSITGNSMAVQPTGDTDDFFSFKTPADRPTIKREGGKFIYLESSNVYDVGISARADDTYSGTLNYEKDNHMMTMLGKNSPLGFKANSDYDDYIKIQTTSNIPEITVASSSGFKINAGGTNSLLLNHAGGNVGIGTDSPARNLHVSGTDTMLRFDRLNDNYGPALLLVNKNASDVVQKSWLIQGQSDQFYIGDWGTAVSGSINESDKRWIIQADGDTIIQGGNIGIGTTSPLSKFSMNSGTNGFRIDSSGIVQQGTWNAGKVTTATVVADEIGIGTSTPYGLLHITDGSVSTISAVSIPGSMIISDDGAPRIYFENTGEGAGDKVMGIDYATESLIFRSYNDASNSLDVNNILVVNRDGNVGIATVTPAMKFSVQGDALADSWNVYSNIYQGEALSKLRNIKAEKDEKGDWAKVDHDTLPEGVVSHTQMDGYVLPTMSIDALAQMNTKAVQELYEINVSQTERIENLEADIARIYDMLYNNCVCDFTENK